MRGIMKREEKSKKGGVSTRVQGPVGGCVEAVQRLCRGEKTRV